SPQDMAQQPAGIEERQLKKNAVRVPFAIREPRVAHFRVDLPAILAANAKQIVATSLHLAVHGVASQVPCHRHEYQEVDDGDDGKDLILAHQPSDQPLPLKVAHPLLALPNF